MLQESLSNIAVITDTSCFILLDKINALHILNALYSDVITTPQIASEFGKALPDWVKIKAVTDIALLNNYAQKVDIGEASAIALAMELPSPLLILDDLKGRNLAQQLHLKYTGTLGVLILAKQQGVIETLKPYIDLIRLTDFRIPEELLKNILKSCGE